jgi:Iap family predicted aminopeptidase
VNVGETPDGLVGNFTAALYRPPLEPPWAGRPVDYPGVTVEAVAGRELLSTMTAGRPVEIRVEHRARTLEKESWNVVGRLGAGEEHALLGAHYDSQAEGPCVWDNGTGVAALIDSARVLRGAERARAIVFVAFGVEEVGLWGSTWYTVQHADELDSLVGMVNLDAVASRYPAKPTIWTDEAMRDFALEAAAAQGWRDPLVFDARLFAFSDNSPFTDAGVPSCWPWEFPPIHPYYHSAGDVRALVDSTHVAETGAVATKIVERLATVAQPALGRARAPGDPVPG